MKSEKRSLAINEMKEALDCKSVKKICGGRVWVVKAKELDRTEQSVLNKIATLGLSAKVNRVKKAKKQEVVKTDVSPERDKIRIDISSYISKPM